MSSASDIASVADSFAVEVESVQRAAFNIYDMMIIYVMLITLMVIYLWLENRKLRRSISSRF